MKKGGVGGGGREREGCTLHCVNIGLLCTKGLGHVEKQAF